MARTFFIIFLKNIPPLEIFKSYENALTGSDFEIIFSGKDEELGRYGEAMDSIPCFS